MRNSLRSVFLVITVVVLVSCIGAGCSSSEDNYDNSGNQVDARNVSESVELDLWVNTSEESEFDKGLREEFLRKYPNISINITDKSGDINSEYSVAFATGIAPDYISLAGPVFKRYVQRGCFAELDEYIEKWEEKDTHTGAYREEIAKYNGKNYGIVNFLGPMMFGYHKALFRQAGLQPPKTWDEMVSAAVKLTDRDKEKYGYAILLDNALDWFLQFYVWQAGGDFTHMNDDGTIKLQFTSPAVIKAVELYRELKWKHNVVQKDFTMSYDGLLREFAAGKVAMMIFAPDWVPWVVNYGMKTEDLGIIPMPVGPTGEPVTSTGVCLGAITSTISQAKKDAAWKWLSFVISKDVEVRRLKYQESKGIVPPKIMIYNDLKQSDITRIDPTWEDALHVAAVTGRDEYAGKAILSKYIVAAVQKVILDKDADPVRELGKQQELAQKEVVNRYNSEVKYYDGKKRTGGNP